MKLKEEFYLDSDVVKVARNLIGKVLFTRIDNMTTAGIITETEAYNGVVDKASHAYGDRRTPRTEIMYSKGGLAYIYLCYGLHSLFNVVTNRKNIPHAVLIRAIVPYKGAKIMESRRHNVTNKRLLINGPGKVCTALGIHYSLTGTSLLGTSIWIEDKGFVVAPSAIKASPRIGVAYAGKDALLPYRFNVDENYFRKLLPVQ